MGQSTRKSEFQKQLADRLGRGANRDDLILEICEQTGLSWSKAEDFLGQVEQNLPGRISRWRALLWMMLSILACVEGALQAGLAGYILYQALLLGLKENGSAPSPAAVIWSLFYSQYLIPVFIAALTGLLILAGGVYWLGESLRGLAAAGK